jgi:isopentenyl-diphosphate delta-isomerase
MKISIVIPTLNEEENIGVLLEALLQQTMLPDEIIVVDGGSEDETVPRARCFPGVSVIAAQPPVGAQRQLGLEHARGEWCVFLDADTRPSPDYLQRCISAMERRRLDVACPFYWPYRSILAIRVIYGFFDALFLLAQWLVPSGAGSGIVTRRAHALAAGGFRLEYVFDDIEFIRRASRSGRFGMLGTLLEVSDRRFREEGILRVLGKYALLSAFFLPGFFRMANRVPYALGHYWRRKEEYVVLVDETDRPLGIRAKNLVHSGETPLHRAFSAFLFNRQGQLLTQQRSNGKKTWPLVWSNSCCGHPGPGESRDDAARRRIREELGITQVALRLALPDYQYCARKGGLVENEICPVLIGLVMDEPQINLREVEAVRWVAWEEFLVAIAREPESVSPWCVEEAQLLEKSGEVRRLLAESAAGLAGEDRTLPDQQSS